MKSQKLPHFSRKYPAISKYSLVSLGLAGLVITLFIVNLDRQFALKPAADRNPMIFSKPKSAALIHFRLAKEYALNLRPADARRELAITAKYAPGNTAGEMVLGATTAQNYLDIWEKESRQLESDRLFWKTIASNLPDYRDAYLSWAIAAYRGDNLAEARTALTAAKGLDPNHPVINLFWRLLF